MPLLHAAANARNIDIQVHNPRRICLMSNIINKNMTGPLDSHKADGIIELKESHTKSFRFLKQICLSKFSHSYNQTECYYTNTLHCQAWPSTGIIVS